MLLLSKEAKYKCSYEVAVFFNVKPDEAAQTRCFITDHIHSFIIDTGSKLHHKYLNQIRS